MSSANTTLRVTELDFNSIKNNLKTFLRNQTEFQDYDFEGSGMSVLLDVLAYNTHYMGYYLNVAANEMFLDTAQIRQSVVSHAKLIGYVPASKKSARANVSIVVTPSTVEDPNLNLLTLGKYTKFIGEPLDGESYTFVTLYANTASKSNGTFTFNNINLVQGDTVTLQYLVDNTSNPKRRYTIPSSNVDTTSISVSVQESSSNTFTNAYTLATDITELTSNSAVYFIEENEQSNYTIYFGDGVIGKKPKDGNIVICTYLDTLGEQANKVNNFTVIESGGIGGYYKDNVSIRSAGPSSLGSDKETIEEARFRAPFYYTTQNRAVTTDDYATLITKDFPNVESVSVWGGQDNDPPIYGKVFISLKTKNNYALSNLDKQIIKEELIESRNVLTVTPELVDPDFTYVIIRGQITYNPNITTKSPSEIENIVKAAIEDYETFELNRFNSTFRKSKLQNRIEVSEQSITGSDVRVFLQKRILLDTTITKKYDIVTNFPIKKGDFNNRISSYPQIKVFDSSGIERSVFFEEVPAAFTGVDGVEIVNPGINYTSIPTITIIGDGSGATAVARVAGGRITSIEVTNKGSNYTRATVSILGGDGSEASAVSRLESKFGKLRTYYTKPNGEKVIVNENAGNINYETGFIELLSLKTTGAIANDFYDENVLALNLPIDKEIITPLRNRIITVDQNDPIAVQIEVIAEK